MNLAILQPHQQLNHFCRYQLTIRSKLAIMCLVEKTTRIISKRAKNWLLILKSYMLIMKTSSEKQQVSPLDDFCYFMLMVQDQLAEESKQQRRGEQVERQEYVYVWEGTILISGRKSYTPPSHSQAAAAKRLCHLGRVEIKTY